MIDDVTADGMMNFSVNLFQWSVDYYIVGCLPSQKRFECPGQSASASKGSALLPDESPGPRQANALISARADTYTRPSRVCLHREVLPAIGMLHETQSAGGKG
jgi:hypothetical protein